jgi:hypothetical protein
MHLRWDRSFHAIAVLLGLLAVLAFVAFTALDVSQSEPDVIWRAAQPAEVP